MADERGVVSRQAFSRVFSRYLEGLLGIMEGSFVSAV